MVNIKQYKDNKFKISTLTWNEEFELPDGSYSVSYIPDDFRYFIKKHKKLTDNPLKRIDVNQMENRITFRMKTGYYLELLMPETMKVLGSTNRIKMVKI